MQNINKYARNKYSSRACRVLYKPEDMKNGGIHEYNKYPKSRRSLPIGVAVLFEGQHSSMLTRHRPSAFHTLTTTHRHTLVRALVYSAPYCTHKQSKVVSAPSNSIGPTGKIIHVTVQNEKTPAQPAHAAHKPVSPSTPPPRSDPPTIP